MPPGYHRLRFRVSPADEELLTAWLWSEGVEGLTSDLADDGNVVVTASFREEKLLVTEDAPAWLPAVEILDSGWHEERDWLASWRAAATPISLGGRLLVDPREWEPAPEAPSRLPEDRPRAEGAIDGRFVLRIPARTAFGVGSHESTRLAYELLEATPLSGKRVLDVGCGSGILAMAALLLGAQSAVGFDFDPAAALLAGQYARHNGVAPAIFTGTVAALAPPRSGAEAFDVVVLNVLPHEIADELRQVIELLAPRGELLVSGVLGSEAAAVERTIAGLGCVKEDSVEDGEWIGLRFRRRSGLASTPA